MQEQNKPQQPQNPNQPVVPVTSPKTQNTPVKGYGFLITLLSILLLLAVGSAGFFAYQTQNLVKQLTELKSISSPTPLASPQPSANPDDPTTNWEVYTNTQYSFEIKYPSSYEVLTDKDSLYGWPKAIVLFYNGGQSYDLPVEIWDTELEYKEKYPEQTYDLTVFKTNDNKFITLVDMNKEQYVPEIISTFKFIEPDATSSPVACTMDAKICPDGSSVGREGPNCEFAPCPN